MNSLEYARNRLSKKYEILLKFLNKILANVNLPPINDATEFKNIKRKDILFEDNIKIIDEMELEIRGCYNNYSNFKLGSKDRSKTYIFTLLKGMCEELYFKFKSITVKKRIGKNIVSITYYDIAI